jgi:hypothetical protein
MMRTFICLCFAAIALQLHGQGEVFTPIGSYSGELPHGPNAVVVFTVVTGEFTPTNGPVKMQLVGRDLELQDDIITLRALIRRTGNRIRVSFPFGGNYTGRYVPERNAIVGHFGGFALRGKPGIPRGRFEMTLVAPN